MRSDSMPVFSPSPLDSFDALRGWADCHIAAESDCQVAAERKHGRTEGWFPGPLLESAAGARPPIDSGVAFSSCLALLSDGLAAMRERGELRPEADPDELASALLAALQGGILLSRVKRDIAPLQAALGFMLNRVRSFAASEPGGIGR